MYSSETFKHSRGAALVITMLVMAVLLLAGTTFLTISSTETQIALNEQVSGRAFLLAEAGIQQAIAQLNTPSGYTGGTYPVAGGGSYTVTVTAATVQTCLTNDAMDVDVIVRVPVGLGQAQTELKTIVDKVSYPFQWAAFGTEYLYLLGLGTQSKVDSFDSRLGAYSPSNASAGARLGSGGSGQSNLPYSYLAAYSVQVNGDLQSSYVVWTFNSTVSGSQIQNAPSVVLPAISSPGAVPCAPLTVASGASYPLNPGTSCFTTLTLGDGARLTTSGPTTVYLTGPGDNSTSENIIGKIGNNVKLGNDNGTDLTLITKSDGASSTDASVIAGTGFTLYGSIYGRNTVFWFGDGAALYGSIIGGRIFGTYPGYWNNQPPTIHYDLALAQRPFCSGKYAVRRGTWREITP
jgi:hypothetical protein